MSVDTPSPARTTESTAAARAYIEGVAGAGVTARQNVEAWNDYAIMPHVMTDVRRIDTTVSILGRTLPTPIIAAPWAGHGYAHRDGEWVTARASVDTGVTLGLSSGSTKSIESVAAISGPYIQQIYLPSQRDLLNGFLERVVASGAFALALTVDNPSTPQQHSFRKGLSAVTLSASANFPEISDRRVLSSSANLGSEDIRWLQEATGLPVLVKGILRADDALRVIDYGADGVIISNHAGRQLDGVVATARALPSVAAALAGQGVPLLVDGGVRSGADVLKAIALGADAVLVGRPIASALLDGGYDAVRTVLGDLVADFELALTMTGTARASDISRTLIA